MEAERDKKLRKIHAAILESYGKHGELSHLDGGDLPSRQVVWGIVEDLLRILFPGFLEAGVESSEEIADKTSERLPSVERRLKAEIEKGLRFRKDREPPEERSRKARAASLKLLGEIPAIRDILATDIEAAFEGDPAATSNEEIIVAYPGLQAIAVQRLAHVLYEEGIPLVPRVMTEYAHSLTGIDIHPGARIGKRFFIDHGTGVVIGETTTIGDNVKIYQGVTLGARSFQKDEEGRIIKGTKRHPDIDDAVTIYSGATILGDVRIGKGSVIGGNVWLVHSVPPKTRMLVTPPQEIRLDKVSDDYQI
jgi:serine O-acetyltransferase